MTGAEPGWSALKYAVSEALELPADARDAHLEARWPDPEERDAAVRLLRACEEASTSPVLDRPAAEYAISVLAEVDAQESELPEALHTALAGRYSIERELGRGGMARVYLALDDRHGRRVALKLLEPALMGDGLSRAAARFQREIEFAAGLSHPHILPLHDSGSAGGLLYYITPYVEGESLRERLGRTGTLPLLEALGVMRDVARALDHAHRHGVVHRDVKPGNVLLSEEGDALVADFGVSKGLAAARGPEGAGSDGWTGGRDGGPDAMGSRSAELTEDALVLGTPAYMAPEQVRGDPGIDHRADLYAFGAVAYELLTGRAPFAGRPRHEQLAAHLSEAPVSLGTVRPDVPRALAELVDRLLAKRPEDRPNDAAEVVRLLDEVLMAERDRSSARERIVSGEEAAAPSGGGPELRSPADERGTEDRAAFELYRKGRHLVGTRQREALARALRYLEEAIALDPEYALAHAGVADAWTFLGIFGHVPPHEAFPRARAAAERAIAIDGALPEAHATLAHLLVVYDWDWEAAATAFERTIALDPGYPAVRLYHASLLHAVGRSEEALAELTVARELDPLAPTGILSGRIYVDTQRPDEAIRVLQEEIDLEPRLDVAHEFLGHAYLQKGRPEEAISSVQRAEALGGPRGSAQLAYVYAKAAREADARRVLARLHKEGPPPDLLGYHLAMAFGALGETDEAFRWLEAAYEQRAGFMSLLAVATGFESLRSDPRFEEMVRRMGLA